MSAGSPALAGSEERRIVCDGVELHVVSEGPLDAAPVLLLHGFTGSVETLEGAAAGLSDRYRVHRVDLLGHGASDAPRDAGPYRMERCVAQLAALLDALGVGGAHVLGYSMGGRSALALACAHPARLRSLVLIGASAGIADPAARRERRRADEALAARIDRQGVPAFVEQWMALPLFASQLRLGEAALARARRQRLACRAHGLAHSLRGMGSGAQPALHERLAGLEVPALLVAGREDPKFCAIACDLAARLPRARVEIVPEAGHAVHLENPEAFLRLTRTFLAEAEARSTTHPEEP